MPKQKQVSLLKLINPTERQMQAFQSVAAHDFTFYGGAAGGGKSYWLRWACIWLLIEFWQKFQLANVTVAIFCEDYPSLYDRQISKMQTEFPAWLGKLRLGETKEFVLHEQFGSGKIALRNLDKPEKYLSAEFAGIAVDELTKNTKAVFDFLRLRLRWPGVERPKFIAGSNPGGAGHSWVKDLWINRDFPSELRPIADQFSFIPAIATDNPHLSKTYWNQLNTLPLEMRKIYVGGDWNVFAGQYFDIFDPFQHVQADHNLKPWTTRWLGVDWGFKHPASVHWFAQPQSDRTVTYREFIRPGLSPVQLAEEIVSINAGDDLSEIHLSPDAFCQTMGADTIAQQMNKVFRKHNLPDATEAEDGRINGWAMMYDYLRMGKWVIDPSCVNLIKTLPMLTRDVPKKPEDCIKFDASENKADGDDAADSARYGLRSHFRETIAPLAIRVDERFEQIRKDEPGVSWTHLMMAKARIESEERLKGPRPMRMKRRTFGRFHVQ
jgi:phage terminase large subunit